MAKHKAQAEVAPSLSAFARFLTPVAPADFFAQYSGSSHLLVSRLEPAYFSDLLTEAEVERVISMAIGLQSTGSADSPRVELLRPQGKHYVTTGKAAQAGFAKGATIRVSRLDQFWPNLADVARDLRRELAAPISINLYVTPPTSQGLRCHFDRHDVLILQVGGRKSWKLRSQPQRWPLEHLPSLPFETAQQVAEGRLSQEQFDRDVNDESWVLELRPGDSLYIPQGRRHEAITGAETSVHLTLGIHPIRYIDVASFLLGRAARDERWRQAAIMPYGDEELAARLLSELLAELAGNRDELAFGFRGIREILRSTLDAHEFTVGTDSSQVPITAETIMRRAAGVTLSLEEDGERVLFKVGEFQMVAPRTTLSALAYIGENRVFCARDICENLTEEAKVLLVAKLAEAGVIQPSG